MSRLSTFFKESDESFGVFLPEPLHHGNTSEVESARTGQPDLRNAGFAEDEVLP